ncbi:c-type cytochrome [Paenibacillus elgii]|uniref:c-type cytochrome n=1 Tax=Paenibacillus elgii TaxID=189691 RepID=UPI001EF988CF|nr:cytochrome c [Paenibacillus elgii]
MRTSLPFFLIVAMSAVALSACSSQATDQGKGMTVSADVKAEAIYKKQCLSCHAADLRGKVGPGLQEIGSKMTEQQLFGIIQDGARGMPAFKKVLSADELQALSQWLSTKK